MKKLFVLSLFVVLTFGLALLSAPMTMAGTPETPMLMQEKGNNIANTPTIIIDARITRTAGAAVEAYMLPNAQAQAVQTTLRKANPRVDQIAANSYANSYMKMWQTGIFVGNPAQGYHLKLC